MRWPSSRARLLGQIDHVNDRVVRGWAWRPKEPTRRVALDVFFDDIYLGTIATGVFRRDLADHGIGDGRHAFAFHLPDDVPGPRIDVARLCVATAGPVRRTLPVSEALSPSGDRSRTLAADHRQVLGPYLASLRPGCVPASADMGKPGDRPRIDAICADASGHDASAFVVHIARKYARPELETGDLADLWRWYLGTYAMERGSRLAPLSRSDIAHLNAPQGEAGTYASALFADGEDASAPAYRWTQEARRMFAADCLVPEHMIERLRAPARAGTSGAYPLSTFMALARRETAILRRLPVTSERHRRRLYALFLILALRAPSTLSYLPPSALHRLLDDGDDFERALDDLFGPHHGMTRARYVELLAQRGGAGGSPFSAPRYQGHRVRHGPTIVTSAAPVDVQIFGPFSRRMGLGESCRRVARALAATPFSVNRVDYDIGNASARIDARETCGAPRAARLNILHLNAEEIPEAFAYLPDVFARAPVVAIPYWELNRPSAVHRLGLRTVDELWVASRFLDGVFAGAGVPIRWIGMGFDDLPIPTAAERHDVRARFGMAPGTFMFLTTSDALSWVQRKNPLGVIAAFRAAFQGDENVGLLVKTHNLGGPLSPAQVRHWDEVRALCAADPRLQLVDESVDASTQRALCAASDGLVSLHRAEGLGLDIIDALRFGTPVVATAYSGTLDLCTPDTAWLVEATLHPVGPADYSFVEPGHVWAEPAAASAVAALQGVYADAALRTARVDAGRRLADAEANPSRFAARLDAEVRRLIRGPAVV